RIVTSGVGSRRPFADETSSENMARNRRVEVFLFRPIQRVASQSGVSVTVRFSGPGRLNGPGTGKVSMSDRPGNVVLIQVRDLKSGTLLKAHWEMEFVAIIGAQVGDNFLPMKSVVWRLEDDHVADSSGALNPTKTEVKAEAPQNGAPG